MKHHKKQMIRKSLAFMLIFATSLSAMPEYVKADNTVATVNGISYSSIKEAWNAVKSGGTINLTDNWDIQSTKALNVEKNAQVTVNMNGYIINRHIACDGYSKNSTSDGEVFYIKEGASVTINGGEKSQVHKGRLSEGVWYEDAEYSSDKYSIQGGVIAGGNSTNGAGGIHIKKNATLTLNDVTIAGNMADNRYGGGIRMDGDAINLLMNNSAIKYNAAEGYAGGVYVDGSNCNITLTNSAISYNKTDKDDGGGMYVNDDNVMIRMDDTSEISHNVSGDKGGGIYFNYSKCAVIGGKIEYNESKGGGGGGIYLEHYTVPWSTDSVTIANVTFTGNTGAGDGGAIHSEQEYVTFSGCTITGNTASGKGGGIYIYNDENSISACTITGNTAKDNGGGVYVDTMNDIALGGKVIIKENSVGNKRNNLKLGDVPGMSASFITSPPGIGSEIGITKEGEYRIFTTGSGLFPEKYFFSDDETKHIATNEYDSLYVEDGAATSVETDKVSPDPVTKDGSIKGYFSYPSFMDTTADLDGVFYYSDSYFNNPDNYNEQLATMSICLAMSAFNSNIGNDAEGGTDYTLKSKNVVKLMSDIGVKRDDIYLSNTYTVKPKTDSIAVAIGQKSLNEEDGTILVPIAVRGAGYESEWTSNVTIGNDTSKDLGEHAGFADAANKVFSQVQSYIENYGLSQAVSKGKVKFWVTGYSRAGATANLTARRLIDAYGNKNEIYAYCMEAPQGALKTNSTATYRSIHNCINYTDPVPKVAPAYMDFTRYGTDQVFNQNTDKKTKKKVKAQLQAVCDDISYNDYFTIGTIDLFSSSVANMIFNAKWSMIHGVTEATEDAPKDAGAFMDAFMDKFREWAIKDRAAFSTAPTNGSEQDLRENGSSLESVSFEKSLQLIVPMVFSKSEDDLADLMDVAMKRANELSLTTVYLDLIRGKWYAQSKSVKQDWIWNKLWYQVVEVDGKECIADQLSAQELADLKTAWPTLMDTLFTFLCRDYNYGKWAKASVIVNNQTVSTLYDQGLNVLGTLAYNANSLMQAHYPEINYAWLRTLDSNYSEDTNAVQITGEATPTIQFSLDKTEYKGDQTLKLTTDKETAGTGLYYRLTTTINNQETTSAWMPYNNGIILPTGMNTTGGQIAATYKVEVKAAYCRQQAAETKTYTIQPEAKYTVKIVDSGNQTLLEEKHTDGDTITISAPNQENKFFTEWTKTDGVKLSDAKKKTKTITFTMPKNDVTLTADYKALIDQVTIDDLTAPEGNVDFNTKATVTLTGNGSAVEESKAYDVIWTIIKGEGDTFERRVVTAQQADYATTYEPVIVLKPEEGVREFADSLSIHVNNSETALGADKTEKQKDGSIWVYCGEMTSNAPKYKGLAFGSISVTAKTGTKISDLGLSNTAMVDTEGGWRVAYLKNEDNPWSCDSYNSGQAGSYTFTAEVDLKKSQIAPADGTDKVIIKATVTLEADQETAAAPTLTGDSNVPGTYKEEQTIHLETATSDAQIKYKINNGAQTDYNPEAGITLTIPADAKSGTETEYTVTAWATAKGMADSTPVTLTYKIVKPYTVTISYRDTGVKNPDTETSNWTKEATTTTYLPGETAMIIADEEADEQFEKWETDDASGITLSDAEKTGKLIKVENISKDINLTAVYNPIIKEINLTLPSPVTGEKLAQTITDCDVTITETYNLAEDFSLSVPVTWTPKGNNGTATAYQSYTAKMAVTMDTDLAKFYVSNKLVLTVKDAKDDTKVISSSWSIEKNEDGKEQLVVYAVFDKTSKVKATSIEQPDSIAMQHGVTENDILEELAKKSPAVQVELANGASIQTGIIWNSIENYDQKAAGDQTATATGTVSLPEYIDGSELDSEGDEGEISVSVSVYIAGAEKAKAPTVSVNEGVYTQKQQVLLLSETADADIYYTTNGAEPETSVTGSTKKYDGLAITINCNTTLKAIAVKDGLRPSVTATYQYYIHTHKDADKDGKCDGIDLGNVDENGKTILDPCDTVLLGRSTDSAGADASVAGELVQDDGNGTIYVAVQGSDIVEDTSEDKGSEDSEEDTATAAETLNWKYSNEIYPTTLLTYDYKPQSNDSSDSSESVTMDKHQYLFAGWYQVKRTVSTDEEGNEQTTTDLKPCTEMPEGTAYAKFTDATVLQSKAQITATTTNSSEKTNIRFLSSVDALNYREIGFDIEIHGKKNKLTRSSNKVYKKVYESDGTVAVEKDPKEVFNNNLSIDFFALVINNIPQSAFDSELKVTAYWRTLDGTKVYGEPAVRKVNDMIEK